MSHEDMRNYILACGAGESSARETRIVTIFADHGVSSTGTYNDRLTLFACFSLHCD